MFRVKETAPEKLIETLGQRNINGKKKYSTTPGRQA